MRVFSSNILFLSKYLASIACSNVTVAMLFRKFARAMLMFSRDICVPKRRHKCHARTSASRERNFETEHCCKLWKQDIYLEIRYLRKIPAFLGRLWSHWRVISTAPVERQLVRPTDLNNTGSRIQY